MGGTVWGRMIGRWVANLRLERAIDRRINRSGVNWRFLLCPGRPGPRLLGCTATHFGFV